MIDIRLVDESNHRREVRRITPMGSQPVRVLRNRSRKSEKFRKVSTKSPCSNPEKERIVNISTGNILTAKNVSRISTSPTNKISSKQFRDTDISSSEKKIKLRSRGRKAKRKVFSTDNTSKLKIKHQKRNKSDHVDSKEIGIFNIDEAKEIESMGSHTAKGSMDYNSPTPKADNTKLDIALDDLESRTQCLRNSIINISTDGKEHRPKAMVDFISNINNSQGSAYNDPTPEPIKLTQNVGTSPSLPKEVVEYKDIAIGTHEEPVKFELKKTKLYQIFEKYFDNVGELSDHVYSDFEEHNILSPQDTYSTLIKTKMVIQRQNKGVKDDNDTNFIRSYYKIGMRTLEYLMQVCNLTEYYQKVKTHYYDDTLDNSIKTLIRIK